MSFYLKKEWTDQEDGILNVYIYYAATSINKMPVWEKSEKRVLSIDSGITRKKRSKVIKLPRSYDNFENYLLHYYFKIDMADGITKDSDVFIEEIVADDSFTFIDYEGEYTNICLYWSISGWGAPNYSAMFVDGITFQNQFSALHFYHRSNDHNYLKGRTDLLKSLPLPHIFRGKAHGPKGFRINYCYHIVSKTVYHDYGFWDNNAGLNYHKIMIDKYMWQNLFGKNTPGHTITGNIKTIPQFYIPQFNESRSIYVYLPPSYNMSNKRYPVIYMQDGQNLFDAALSYAEEWGVDETMEMLSNEGIEAIVVGIANWNDKRIMEYNPFYKGLLGINGDKYIKFIIDTLKPKIDADFRTLPDKKNTGIIGASLGGLVSLYAFFNYPDIFGFTGALSHWMWIKDNITPDNVYNYIKQSKFNDGTIYLDIGTDEVIGSNLTGIELNPSRVLKDTRILAELLREIGYRDNINFKYTEIEKGQHRENDWAARFPDVIRFLLKDANRIQ